MPLKDGATISDHGTEEAARSIITSTAGSVYMAPVPMSLTKGTLETAEASVVIYILQDQ